MFVQQTLMMWCVGSHDNIIEKYVWQSVGFSLFCGCIECFYWRKICLLERQEKRNNAGCL